MSLFGCLVPFLLLALFEPRTPYLKVLFQHPRTIHYTDRTLLFLRGTFLFERFTSAQALAKLVLDKGPIV